MPPPPPGRRQARELEDAADREASDLTDRLDSIADRLEQLVNRLEQQHPPPPDDANHRTEGPPDGR